MAKYTQLFTSLACAAALVIAACGDDGAGPEDDPINDPDGSGAGTGSQDGAGDDDGVVGDTAGTGDRDGMVGDGAGAGAGMDGATETNVFPAPCNESLPCPDGIECIFINEEDTFGSCDVSEMSTSSATPAACETSEDCPAGIECISFSEGGPSFCDVSEMQQ